MIGPFSLLPSCGKFHSPNGDGKVKKRRVKGEEERANREEERGEGERNVSSLQEARM